MSSLNRRPSVIDLFCGAGGLSLGFEMAGYHVGPGIEMDEMACRTYAHNFTGRCHHGDIEQVSDPRAFVRSHGVESVDVVVGGPPCQGFSRVGRGKMRSLRGESRFEGDPRNELYREFVRFVQALRPAYFVMENVPDMPYYRDSEGCLLDRILEAFSQLGYSVEWRLLRADEYGVPQTRARVFVIGNCLGADILWPKKTHEQGAPTVWEAISDLPVVHAGNRRDEMPCSGRFPLSQYQELMRKGAGPIVYNHQTRWHNAQDLEAFAWLPEGGKYASLPDRLKRYRDDIFSDKYRKLYRDRPSWTVEAHIGRDTYRHVYPSRQGEPEPPRTISVREAARLQSFPDGFRFLGAFTRQFWQVGNAVPPLLAKAVAITLLPSVCEAIGR